MSATRSTSPYSPAAIIANVQIQHYFRIAAMVIVLYDSLLTLEREVKYFWGKPWSHIKFLYFLNRYWGMLVLVLDTWIAVLPFKNDFICEFQFVFQSWSGLVSILLIEAILMIRVHALYDRSRKASVVLLTMFTTQALAMTAILSVTMMRVRALSFTAGTTCGTHDFPRWFSLFWLPTVLIDFLLLLSTLCKAVAFVRLSSGRSLSSSRLFETLVRDQILYFVGIFVVAGANMAAVSLTPLLIGFAVGFVLGFPLIMGSRLLLNLREMADDSEGSTLALSTLAFVPGQTTRTQQIVTNLLTV